MSATDLFYVLGIALVVVALGVSAVGIRSREFPSAGVFRVGILLFAALVAVTATYAVLNAKDEQDKRNDELAAEKGAEEKASPESKGKPSAGGAGGTIKFEVVDGAELAYVQKDVSAPAGDDKIELTNPQGVGHDVAIAKGSEVLGKTDITVKGAASGTVTLTAGDYVFYCTVPGHREAGMEGTLKAE